MNDEEKTAATPRAPVDPHGLLASGVSLATIADLARGFGICPRDLRSVLYNARIRYVRRWPKRETLFPVDDAGRAVEPNLSRLRAKAEKHVAKMRTQNAAGDAHRARARKATARVQAPSVGRVTSAGPSAPSRPEVFVRIRRGAAP